MAKTPKVTFKAGDDFKLILTVNNKGSAEAVAAQTAVDTAQAAYDAAVEEGIDGDALQELVDALNAAKEVYEEAILVDISDWEITASMRWAGKHIADFDVAILADGQFRLTKDNAETQTWKPRLYDADVQFIIDGSKVSSQTFNINVVRDITYE